MAPISNCSATRMPVEVDRNASIGVGSWTIRRRYLFANTAFNMLVVLLALLFRPDSSVAESAVTMAFVSQAMSLGSYVFGAIWDDKNIREAQNAP
jgi:hypothetical protein